MRIAAHIVAVGAMSVAGYAGAPHAMQGAPSAADAAAAVSVLAFQGEAAERFLETAAITALRDLGQGVTRPTLVTLELDGVTHDAVFKSIDRHEPGLTRRRDGSREVDFQDTWETEVAAYRLDRMIGLGLVPATVQRTVDRETGSLQWWVDAAMSEEDRLRQGVPAPDGESWSRQSYKMWLFDELIANVDRHMNNLLITPDFEVRLIDHSRSFRTNSSLRNPERLVRFSDSVLKRLETLTFENVKAAVGRHLSNTRIRRMLDRRDAIVELARQRVAERGRAAVIYP